MVELNAYKKSELRRKYEKLDRTHQGGMPRPIHNPTLRQLETDEILGIFEENEHYPGNGRPSPTWKITLGT